MIQTLNQRPDSGDSESEGHASDSDWDPETQNDLHWERRRRPAQTGAPDRATPPGSAAGGGGDGDDDASATDDQNRNDAEADTKTMIEGEVRAPLAGGDSDETESVLDAMPLGCPDDEAALPSRLDAPRCETPPHAGSASAASGGATRQLSRRSLRSHPPAVPGATTMEPNEDSRSRKRGRADSDTDSRASQRSRVAGPAPSDDAHASAASGQVVRHIDLEPDVRAPGSVGLGDQKSVLADASNEPPPRQPARAEEDLRQRIIASLRPQFQEVLTRAVQNLHGQLDAANVRTQTAEARVQNLHRQLKVANARDRTAEARFQNLHRQLQAANERAQNLHRQLKVANARTQTAEARVQNLHRQLKVANVRTQTAEARFQNLHRQLQAANVRTQTAEARFQSFRERVLLMLRPFSPLVMFLNAEQGEQSH